MNCFWEECPARNVLMECADDFKMRISHFWMTQDMAHGKTDITNLNNDCADERNESAVFVASIDNH